jgi:ubiquinone/menaquinone biosynthesis C-methylase UbiE
MIQNKAHWVAVYKTKPADGVSWFQPRLKNSLRMIAETGLSGGRVLDVGAGASTLVDDLLRRGFEVSALDIAPGGLDISRNRLGERGGNVEWIEADITQAELPPGSYDIWHDRALFHFLTDPEDRKKYVGAMSRALKQKGHAIIAVFDLKGPDRCSGLRTMRYSSQTLSEELSGAFQLVSCVREAHQTPGGGVQHFIYCHFERN